MVKRDFSCIAPQRKEALLSLLFLCGGFTSTLDSDETYYPLADFFNLTGEERNRRTGNGSIQWNNSIQNTRQRLKEAQLLDGSKNGEWKLTKKGIVEAEKISRNYMELKEIFQNSQNTYEQPISNSKTPTIVSENGKLDLSKIISDNELEKSLEIGVTKSADISEPNNRIESISYRIVRDTVMSKRIKNIHKFKCQICDKVIVLKNNVRYTEAHHIKPLGTPHNGPDIAANIICVCPDDHVRLDFGAMKIDKTKLTMNSKHQIGDEFILYHNDEIFGK